MRAAEAAGKALYLVEHPRAHAASWEQLSQRTQLFWIMRAGPIALAVANIWENH